MDHWLALGIFLLGAGSGALLTRIAQRGLLERHSLLAAENSRLGGHAFIATQSDESSAAAEHHFYHRCSVCTHGFCDLYRKTARSDVRARKSCSNVPSPYESAIGIYRQSTVRVPMATSEDVGSTVCLRVMSWWRHAGPLFTVHEGAPFVGGVACAHNLLQKGRPFIMRFRQLSLACLETGMSQ